MKTRLRCWLHSQKHKNTITEQNPTEERKTLPLSFLFHTYKRIRLLDSEQVTKLFYMANTLMLHIHLIQTSQLFKSRRKHLPYLLLQTSKSQLPIKFYIIWHTFLYHLEINNIRDWQITLLFTKLSICHVNYFAYFRSMQIMVILIHFIEV